MPLDDVTERVVAGRYRLQELLGRGGAGSVWWAEDTLLRRAVAVKEVEAAAQVRDRVLREARAAARVSHPRLVTLFDVVEQDGSIYLVQELVRGGTLSEAVAWHGRLPPARAADIGRQLLEGLEVLHAEGIVHRDVKPSNVMVLESGGVKLADFGIVAVAGDPDLTSTGVVLGSPHYIAPEQAAGEKVDARADLWSLGATLFFAVEGRPPFEGPAIAAMAASLRDDAPYAVHGGDLAPVIERLLNRDPADRPSGGELRALLERVAAADAEPTIVAATAPTVAIGEVHAAPAPGPVDAPAPGVRRPPRRGLAFAIAVVVVLLAGGIALATTMDDRRDPAGTVSAENGDDGQSPTTTPQPDTSSPTTTDAPTSTQAPPATTAPAPDPVATVTLAQTYEDEEAGYSLRYPAEWQRRERSDTITDFVDPATGTYLRVDWTADPGDDAKQAWVDQEPSFASRHPGYQRIRIDETRFKDSDAALWEYTYPSQSATLHAYNLGFVTDDRNRGFALNFQANESRWAESQQLWESLKAEFEIQR